MKDYVSYYRRLNCYVVNFETCMRNIGKRYGVDFTSMKVLFGVEKDEGTRNKEIERNVDVDKAIVSRYLSKLLEAGLVEIRYSQKHFSKMVKMTDLGRRCVEDVCTEFSNREPQVDKERNCKVKIETL
ncbi:MAG: MarR family winged helix-turn-helix transcriptional regulator [Erysipelotrichaceae bacterium]|nr:MarR family winged helix-turn-helix transcriptional regulator [Erysipelotrichaceae bacterium]MDY6035222.1 MarR family winged helix-turn-helix transcriptional regulator [Bulleidia sp.]